MGSFKGSLFLNKCQAGLINWMALWYFVFPLSVYLNPSKGGTTNIFYLGVLFPWVLLLLTGRINLFYKNSIYLGTVLLFFYLWLNSLWNPDNTIKDFLYLLRWFIYALCLLTAPIVIVERFPHFFEKLLVFVFIAAVMGAAITVYFHIEAKGVIFPKYRMRGWGYGYNPIGLGLHYGVAVLIGFFLVDRYKSHAIWIGLASLVPLSAMMLSHSRGPIAALLLCGPLMLFLFDRSKAVIATKIIVLGGVIVAAAYIGWDRLLVRGLSGRPEIWGEVLALVTHSPVWGEGYSLQATNVFYHGSAMTHSHNVVLELLRYGGVLAVLLFLLHLITMCKFQAKSGDTVSGFFIVMLLFTLIVMLSSGWYLLDRPNYYWFGYWYPVGLLMVKQNVQRAMEKP